MDDAQIQAGVDAGYGLHVEGMRADARALDGMAPWPETPEEREAIPDYGDLASTVIWFPVYVAVPVDGVKIVACRNCGGEFAAHDINDGGCDALFKED